MSKLVKSATRAAASIFHGELIGLLVISVLITLGVLAGFVAMIAGVCHMLAGSLTGDGFFYEHLTMIGTSGAFILAFLLFPGITPVVVSFFDQRISRLIEQRYYPHAPAPITTPFWPEFRHDLRFAAKAIFYNILVLPLYLIPPINLVIFYVLNGYLLGQEYFLMVARRHMPIAEAKALYRRFKGTIWLGGGLLAFLTTIPLVNLAAPFWGVALMVHLYYLLGATDSAQPSDNTIEHTP